MARASASASIDVTRKKEKKSFYKVEIKTCMFDVFLCNVKISSLVLVRVSMCMLKKSLCACFCKRMVVFVYMCGCMRKCIYHVFFLSFEMNRVRIYICVSTSACVFVYTFMCV